MKKIVDYSVSCIVGIIVYLFWAIPFRCMLNYHEEFQLFQTDSDYFIAHLMQKGGIAVYISEFLVQFYNNYWIGALILALEFVLIQRLTLDILKNIHQTWNHKHSYLLCILSLIPMSLLWIVLGDVNVMHSLIIAVIIALLFIDLLIRIFKNKTYRFIGAIAAMFLFVWLAGTSHYRNWIMTCWLGVIAGSRLFRKLKSSNLTCLRAFVPRTSLWA